MFKVIFFILVLFVIYQIVTRPGPVKLLWFFGSVLFIPEYVVLIPSPQMPFYKILLYVLLLITIKDLKWMKSFKTFPYKFALLTMLVAYLVIGLFDTRVTTFYQIYRPLNFFLENFFVMFLTWYHIRDTKDIKMFYSKLWIFFAILTVYGVCNLLTRHNEYNAILSNGFGVVDFANYNMLESAERFRVSSFTAHPIYYGFLVTLMLLLEFFFLTNFRFSKRTRNKHILLTILLFVNLLLANSRTPLFSLVLGGMIYVLFALKIKQRLTIVTSAILIVGFGSLVSESVRTLVTKSLDTFSSEQNSQFERGSSVDMREKQLEASLLIFAQKPVTGNGFNFIQEGLGYSSDKDQRDSSSELYGFESYLYKLLIEQGLIGIFSNIIFFSLLVIWLLKMVNKVNFLGKKMISITIGALLGFVFFIIGTGDLGTFLFFMGIFGINVKFIYLMRERGISVNPSYNSVQPNNNISYV